MVWFLLSVGGVTAWTVFVFCVGAKSAMVGTFVFPLDDIKSAIDWSQAVLLVLLVTGFSARLNR